MIRFLTRRTLERLELEPRFEIDRRRRIPVAMPDGVQLVTDIYAPRGRTQSPTVLIRSPYGRLPFALSLAGPLATQGYHVVLQSCRGTAGSAGVFDPHHDERVDGLATLEWIRAQPFYDGSILTCGMSYLGYVQWAIAAAAGPDLKAMAMQLTLSDFSQMTYAGKSLMLENALSWTQMVTRMKTRLGMLQILIGQILGRPPIDEGQWRSLPLEALDRVTTGERVSFWRDWMKHASADDPWWQPMNFHRAIPEVRCPISLLAGWHDIFTPWTLRDFTALQAADVPRRLSIGPWMHTDRDVQKLMMDEILEWFALHTGERTTDRKQHVRLFVMGADEWRHFDRWPPESARPMTLHLQPGGILADHLPPESAPSSYFYDPADPTPSIGGPTLAPSDHTVDNAELEARGDVLCFTSEPLEADLDVIGVPNAELFVASTAESADFFVRFCDVDEAGTSRNVCDGLQRIELKPNSEPRSVRVDLWPTAYRFPRGHRLRVQVSSGAFPRWARNPGTREALGTATQLERAEQRIHHSTGVASTVSLPVCATS